MSRLRTYIGVPESMYNKETISITEADMKRLTSIKYVRLDELCTKLGARF